MAVKFTLDQIFFKNETAKNRFGLLGKIQKTASVTVNAGSSCRISFQYECGNENRFSPFCKYKRKSLINLKLLVSNKFQTADADVHNGNRCIFGGALWNDGQRKKRGRCGIPYGNPVSPKSLVLCQEKVQIKCNQFSLF